MNEGPKSETLKISDSVVIQRARIETGPVSYLEDFDEELAPLRKICTLVYDPVWFNFAMICGVVNICGAIIKAAVNVDFDSIFRVSDLYYFSDLIWFIHITICIIRHYVGDLKTSQVVRPRRRVFMYAFDYISTFPVELFCPDWLSSFLVILRTLKLIYIIEAFRFGNKSLQKSVIVRVVQLIIQCILHIMIVAYFFVVIMHLQGNSRPNLLQSIYTVADHVTGRGFGLVAYESYASKLLMLTTTLTFFMGIFLLGTANITFLFQCRTAAKSGFRFKFTCLKQQLQKKHVGPDFWQWLNHYFRTIWTHGGGWETLMAGRRISPSFDTYNLLSRTFYAEIMIDVSVGLFKHSMLLCDLPLPFLRDLSTVVKCEIYCQDQLLYKINEVKDRIIYLFQGTVEIISDEDQEIPVAKFLEGTCFSEICLFVPYKSKYLVKCSSTCVLHVIRRPDFLKMLRKHTAIKKVLRPLIEERLVESKRLKKLQDKARSIDRLHTRKRMTHIGWLIFMLHKLGVIGYPRNESLHTFRSLSLDQFVNDDDTNSIFSPKYLRLYTIPEIDLQYTDSFFIMNKFPYILKPDTGLTLFWEIFIAVIAMTAGILIPFFVLTFEEHREADVFLVIYSFTIIWLIDYLVQLRIFQNDRKRYLGWLDVLVRKLFSITFAFDTLSVIPFEFFACIFIAERFENYVYLNRILKLARVVRLLWHWERRYNSNPLLIRFIAALLCLFYSVFILACILYQTAGQAEKASSKDISTLLFFTVQILTGVCIWVDNYSDYQPYQLPSLVIYILISIGYMLMYAMIFSAYGYSRLVSQQMKHNVKRAIAATKFFDNRYAEYITYVLHNRVCDNEGFGFIYPTLAYEIIPKDILGYLYDKQYGHLFEHFKIFAEVPQVIRREIFEEATLSLHFEAHECVYHVGDLQETIFLLLQGTCQRIDGVNFRRSDHSGRKDLNSLEVVLMVPMRATLVTLTACRMFGIHYPKMREILIRHQSLCQIRSPLAGLRDIRAKVLHIPIRFFQVNVLEDHKQELHTRDVYSVKRNSRTFTSEFDRHGLWLLRAITVNLIILPEGRFLYVWEVQRSCFAFLSALLFFCTSFSLYSIPTLNGFIKWFLELTAIVDLYVRLHVAFYNKEGVLVTHPLKTSRHYLSHGFALDFFGALPLHMLIQSPNYIILNVNKIFQLHRYISFLRFKVNNFLVPQKKIYMFAYVPLMIVLINMLASFMIIMNCHIDIPNKSIRSATITCDKGSLLDIQNTQVVFDTPIMAHIYGIYIVMSIVSKIGIQGFRIEGTHNKMAVGLLSIFAFWWDAANAARVFNFYINQYVRLMRDDVQMRLLSKFIPKTKDNNELLQQVVLHVRRVHLLEESNVHNHIRSFPHNLRRDILYNRFGPVLIKSCLRGSKDIKPLLRNVLLHCEYRIIEQDGVVYRENDVCGYTIIVFRGLVMMQGEERSHEFHHLGSHDKLLRVSLGPGSIIGNLCPLQYNRLCETMITMGVVELLYIKSNKFFEILQHFPSSGEVFRRLRCIHRTHIPGYSTFHYAKIATQIVRWKLKLDTGKGLAIVTILNLMGAFIPQLAYFYQIITVAMYYNYFGLLADVFYGIAIVFVFFLEITTSEGDLMSPLMLITQFFSTWRFVITIFSAIPFYVMIPYSHVSDLTAFYLYALGRSNVLLRNIFMFRVIEKLIPRAATIVFVTKFVSNMVSIILCICSTAAFIVVISESDGPNMNPHLDLHMVAAATPQVKIEHCATYLYIVTNLFTHTSQRRYYPVGFLHIIVFIMLMAVVMTYISICYAVVVSIMQALHDLKSQYLRELNMLLEFMDRNHVSNILVQRVKLYCSLVWRKKSGAKIPELFYTLPSYLQEAIAANVYDNILENCVFFQQVHDDLKRQVYAKLKMDYFNHGEIIVYQGTVDSTIYFIQHGSVAALRGDGYMGDNLVSQLNEGDSFGHLQGISDNEPHLYSFYALTDCQIVYLRKRDWAYMLYFYPGSKKIFESLLMGVTPKTVGSAVRS